MKQKVLRFTVNGQELKSHPVTVVADSRNYLSAEFAFGSEWEGIEKTAVFQAASGAVYHMLVQDGVCSVPEEVIQVPWFRVSVFGGDRLTTNRAEVSVCQSGFLPGVTPPEPTPDIYDQLLSSVAAEREQAAASADAAEAAAKRLLRSDRDANAGRTSGCGGRNGRNVRRGLIRICCKCRGGRPSRSGSCCPGRAGGGENGYLYEDGGGRPVCRDPHGAFDRLPCRVSGRAGGKRFPPGGGAGFDGRDRRRR